LNICGLSKAGKTSEGSKKNYYTISILY